MKRFLVVLLVLAIAGGLFAQEISFGGGTRGGVDLVAGDNDDANDLWVDGAQQWIRLEASAENADGTFGGWTRLEGSGWGGGVSYFGLAWWKPIDQFKLQIGANPDGHFGFDGYGRWMFTQIGGDMNITPEDWTLYGQAFFGGVGSFGMYMYITPVDGLEINLQVPFASGDSFKNAYLSLTAQVGYTITDIGKIGLTFQGGGEDPLYDDASGDFSAHKLWLGFDLQAIDNLNLMISAGFALPVDEVSNPNGKYTPPLSVGVAAQYAAGSFGVRARLMAQFMGKYDDGAVVYKEGTGIWAEVMPFFDLNDNFRVYFDAGLGMGLVDGLDGAILGFHITPWLTYSIGNGTFGAGVRIESGIHHKDWGDRVIGWRVPISISYSF